MKNPKFSVIIPAHNEESTIEKSVKSVLDQSFKDFEIIVVNDGSTDKTEEIVESLIKKNKEKIKLINFDRGHNAAFARNEGSKVARGEIFIFLDADENLDSSFLEKISDDFKKYPKIKSVKYKIEDTHTNWLSKAISLFQRKEELLYGNKRKIISKCNAFVIRKNIFFELGGMDPEVTYLEDRAFERKFEEKGYSVLWDPRITLHSEQPSTFKDLFRRCKWYAKGLHTTKNKKEKFFLSFYLFFKIGFIFFPVIVLFFNLLWGIILIFLSFFITYLYALRTSKNIIWSFIMVPIMYLKNIFEFYNYLKFCFVSN